MPPNAPSIPAKRQLPPKEAAMFREVLNLYENRQLKKGLKTADQILKKFPEHGGKCKYVLDISDCKKLLVRNHVYEGFDHGASRETRGRERTGQNRRSVRSNIPHLLACIRSHSERREELRGGSQIVYTSSEIRQSGKIIFILAMLLIRLIGRRTTTFYEMQLISKPNYGYTML